MNCEPQILNSFSTSSFLAQNNDLDEDEEGYSGESGSDSGEEPTYGKPRSAGSPASMLNRANVYQYDDHNCGITLEEICSELDDCDGLEVLLPTEIESPRSGASSVAGEVRELPTHILSDLRKLNCEIDSEEEACASPPLSPNTIAEMENEESFYRWQAELRRRRISMSSSMGKRTHSEMSADSDVEEDEELDVNDVGFSARRMRKKHRGSLLFQDPPEPRIEELEEPSSDEDETRENQARNMEMPFASVEIIEVE